MRGSTSRARGGLCRQRWIRSWTAPARACVWNPPSRAAGYRSFVPRGRGTRLRGDVQGDRRLVARRRGRTTTRPRLHRPTKVGPGRSSRAARGRSRGRPGVCSGTRTGDQRPTTADINATGRSTTPTCDTWFREPGRSRFGAAGAPPRLHRRPRRPACRPRSIPFSGRSRSPRVCVRPPELYEGGLAGARDPVITNIRVRPSPQGGW